MLEIERKLKLKGNPIHLHRPADIFLINIFIIVRYETESNLILIRFTSETLEMRSKTINGSSAGF